MGVVGAHGIHAHQGDIVLCVQTDGRQISEAARATLGGTRGISAGSMAMASSEVKKDLTISCPDVENGGGEVLVVTRS